MPYKLIKAIKVAPTGKEYIGEFAEIDSSFNYIDSSFTYTNGLSQSFLTEYKIGLAVNRRICLSSDIKGEEISELTKTARAALIKDLVGDIVDDLLHLNSRLQYVYDKKELRNCQTELLQILEKLNS